MGNPDDPTRGNGSPEPAVVGFAAVVPKYEPVAGWDLDRRGEVALDSGRIDGLDRQIARVMHETEAARQQILTACKAHKVACGITAVGKANVDQRLKEGWMMIRTGQGE